MEDDLIKEDTLFFTIDNNKISFEDENEDSIYMQKQTNTTSHCIFVYLLLYIMMPLNFVYPIE